MGDMIKEFAGYENLNGRSYMCYRSTNDKYILSSKRLEKGAVVRSQKEIEAYGIEYVILE